MYGLAGAEKKRRIGEISEMLGLDEFIKRPYSKLSGGQRRRTDIARALIHTPELLILDEPTTGLDPKTRKTVWETVERIRRQSGMSILLTTHYMEESDKADRIVIIDEGKLVAEGSPVQLKDRYSSDCVKIYRKQSDEADKLLKGEGMEFVYEHNAYRVSVPDSAAARQFLINHPEFDDDFEVIKGNMDDVFLRVTGKKLEGGGYEEL